MLIFIPLECTDSGVLPLDTLILSLLCHATPSPPGQLLPKGRSVWTLCQDHPSLTMAPNGPPGVPHSLPLSPGMPTPTPSPWFLHLAVTQEGIPGHTSLGV